VIETLLAEVRLGLAESVKSGQSRRLFHGRGRSWPGLEDYCVDVFSGVVALTIFAERSDESVLLASLAALTQEQGLKAFVVQKRYQKPAVFELIFGELPEPWYAQRGQQKFYLNPQQQNLGFFLDIEPARLWLEKHCKGANILNLFAFTCSFSVVACAAGARQVVNIDMNSRSLSIGKRNHSINSVVADSVSYLGHDIFKSWGKLKKLGPYDIIIVDPPSFQRGSFSTDKDYPKVLRRLDSLLQSGGSALLVSNSPELAASDFSSMIRESMCEGYQLTRLENSADFPDVDAEKSLKMIVATRRQQFIASFVFGSGRNRLNRP
jgi:23S rRNA (cytosine1962-C5)-methyltransferase